MTTTKTVTATALEAAALEAAATKVRIAAGDLYAAALDVAQERLSAAIEAGSSKEFIHWTAPIRPEWTRIVDSAHAEYFARRNLVSDLLQQATVVERILREERILWEDRVREDRDDAAMRLETLGA